jgi:hypothetical protein
MVVPVPFGSSVPQTEHDDGTGRGQSDEHDNQEQAIGISRSQREIKDSKVHSSFFSRLH